MPRENIQKVDGKKNKADDSVRALNTHLPVHQGQDRALLGSAPTFCTNGSISVSLSSRLCPPGFFQLAQPWGTRAAGSVLAPQLAQREQEPDNAAFCLSAAQENGRN